MNGRPAATCHSPSFWSCCVAQAVHASVNAAMHAAGAAPTVARHHLCLATPPPGLHHGDGQVVALAALSAITPGLLQACIRAEERFWALLAEFVSIDSSAQARLG